jgi:2-phosphosulfolactate phosphatase
LPIKIFQGHSHHPKGDVNVVIDVYRAFTVTQVLFLNQVEVIYLASSEQEARKLKTELQCPTIGEKQGIRIPDFDYGNSPSQLIGKSLGPKVIHKTTNGTRAALNAREAPIVYVTGYANAENTALALRDHFLSEAQVNLIASHPTGEDDMVCAHYIQDLLLGNKCETKEIEAALRQSEAAQKFLSQNHPDFPEEDHWLCSKKLDCDFAMQVNFDSVLASVTKKKL